nr:unnamed protein product [Callosobruchus analis]
MILDPTTVNIDQYKKYKNHFTTLTRISKSNFYQNKILEGKNNSKKLWECINDICCSKTRTSDSGEIQMSNGRITKNPNEVANAFAEFYTNVGTELSSKIEKCEKYTFGNKQQISKSIFLKPTCENHVIEKIINLKNNKSPGHDGIRQST